MKNEACVCIRLRRAANALTSYYDAGLKEAGITVNQYSALVHLKKLKSASVSDLAKNMRLERSTLVRNLKPLQKAGYIKDISKDSERNRKLILDASGESLLKMADPLWMKAQETVKARLGKEEIEKLLEVLEKLQEIGGCEDDL